MPAEVGNHGFARTTNWELSEIHNAADKAYLSFILQGSPEQNPQWPHSFQTRLTYVLTDQLEAIWEVQNTGSTEFTFQCALHTYFNVSDIHNVKILGLSNTKYLDNTQNMMEMTDTDPYIVFTGETDRIYLNVSSDVKIADPNGKIIVVKSDNMPDRVVWNPWIEKSKTLVDLNPNDWLRFVCVEAGCMNTPITLPPGQSIKLTMLITVL